MSSKPPRRVIPIQVEQPSSLTSAQRAAVLAACTHLKNIPGALLPIFHAVQKALGYVPKDAVPLIAQSLNFSRAEVHGVLSFYHYFLKEPPGRHVVHVCRAEACQSVGAVELESHAKKTLGIGWHESTSDGAITLEPVYCLGNCALGPSVMVDETLQGRVSPKRFDELVAQLKGPLVGGT